MAPLGSRLFHQYLPLLLRTGEIRFSAQPLLPDPVYRESNPSQSIISISEILRKAQI